MTWICITLSAFRLINEYNSSNKMLKAYLTEESVVPKSCYDYTTLYTSGTAGTSFTRSLNNVGYTTLSDDNEYVNFYNVLSMSTGFLGLNDYGLASGTYIATPKYHSDSHISLNKVLPLRSREKQS